MKFKFSQPLFSHEAIWIIIGLLAFALPILVGLFSGWKLVRSVLRIATEEIGRGTFL